MTNSFRDDLTPYQQSQAELLLEVSVYYFKHKRFKSEYQKKCHYRTLRRWCFTFGQKNMKG